MHPAVHTPVSRQHRIAGQRLQTGRDHLRHQRWVHAERELAAAVSTLGGCKADWLGIAIARMKLHLLDPAIEAAQRALEMDPRCLATRQVLAKCLTQQHRHAEAERVYAEAPQESVATDHDWLLNHSMALVQSDRPQEAIPMLLRAVELKLDSVLAYVRLGAAFKTLKMFEEASECFRTAVTLQPSNLTAHCFLVHLDQFACRWSHFDSDVTAMLRALSETPREMPEAQECTPFALVAIPHHPNQMLHAARLEARRQSNGVQPFKPRAIAPEGERIRIGYLSSDMHQHATAMLITEVFEQHDRQRFDVHVYSHGADDRTPIRARLERAVEHFVDVRMLNAEQTARRVRDDGIDILIDLKGYTQNHRVRTLAYRPAPLQVTWLGFPGTTGADFVDYFIGDPIVTPAEHAGFFGEKLAQMPVCYQPNDRQRPLAKETRRAQWELPEAGPLLCCFNNVYKITPEVFDSWMRIMVAVPDAWLWLLDSNEQAKANLRREAQARGVDPTRLMFAPSLMPAFHQSRLRCADLMLDTWPCNAHTTASDALWAGLPLITLPGETFASRVAASLLNACHLDELVCDSVDSYEATAIELLQDSPRLAALHAHLSDRRMDLPLFDSRRFTSDLEALYLRMVARQRAGLRPEHLLAQA
jgi:predicted O-linked N-acetylglucosamine transferase (SPINDLY family)